MRDKTRENFEQTTVDRMQSYAKAALTVGVGAAFLYRAAGGRAFTMAIEGASRFLREGSGEISRRGLQGLDARGLREVYDSLIGNTDSTLSQILNQQKISLPISGSKNIFDISRTALNLKQNMRRVIENMYDTERILNPLRNRLGADAKPIIDDMYYSVFRGARGGEISRVAEAAFWRTHKDQKIVPQDKLLEAFNEMHRLVAKKSEELPGYIESKTSLQEELLALYTDPENIARITGQAGRPGIKRSFFDKVLGGTQATVDDILAAPERFKSTLIPVSPGENIDAVHLLKTMRDEIASKNAQKGEEFGRLFVQGVRKDSVTGELYGIGEETRSVADKLYKSLSDTLPGTILKLRDFYYASRPPLFKYIPAGQTDPVLANLTGHVGKFASSKDFFRILDRTYETTQAGLRHIPELDDTYLFSGRYGSMPRMLKQMVGDIDYKAASKSRVLRALDLGQSGTPTFWDDIKSTGQKFRDPGWRKNIIDSVLYSDPTEYEAHIKPILEHPNLLAQFRDDPGHMEYFARMGSHINELNKFFSRATYAPNMETARKISQVMASETYSYKGTGKYLIDAILMEDHEMVQALLTRDASSLANIDRFINKDLSSLLSKYSRDPREALATTITLPDRANFFGGTQKMDFFDLLRRELGKEALLRFEVDMGAGATSKLIDEAGLPKRASQEMHDLFTWSMFQTSTSAFGRHTEARDLASMVESIHMMTRFFDEGPYRETLQRLSDEKISMLERMPFESERLIRGSDYPDYIHMKKAISPVDVAKSLIHDINDTTKLKGMFKQFYAGRDNIQDITTLTMFPYFMISRIPDALGKIGLDFSPRSTGNVIDVLYNIMLKRVLPATLGITYFSYLNDMSREITGTSVTGAGANVLARADLAMRSITDATGLSTLFQREKDLNPMLRYWFGSDYHTREEREEWYRSGYSPVRRSRYWYFASLSEFRGADISYWQPNYLRQAHSDWKNKALYDSVWQKWGRSPIPTPTAPWAPLVYWANPYWLEERHAKDRPYPITGKLFAEETPWGAILNPTLGELIKPQRLMHADRLDRRLVDIKALIEERNMEHYRKARDSEKGHLIRIQEGIIEPVAFSSHAAPTMSERNLSVRYDQYGNIINIEVGDYGQYSGETPFVRDYTRALSKEESFYGYDIDFSDTPSAAGTGSFGGTDSLLSGLSSEAKREIDVRSGSILAHIYQEILGAKGDSREIIRELNAYTTAKAGQRRGTRGVITPESIYRRHARYGSHVLHHEEALSDLRGVTAGDDLVSELAYVARYMSGIYGYGVHRLFPGQPRYKLEDAGRMASFARHYWDTSIGGLGGSVGEIIRRFIPFQDRSVEHINPLMNTMPDWLPERFRFGDPMTKIPKGEMRLPGPGYESLYELSPDQFGRYGALDRMRILADIAPFSQEYKIWRDIAQQTVRDPADRKEMAEIRERVVEQSRRKEFFPYRFRGQDIDYKKAIVEEVLNNNYFKIRGDDRVYRMAGITVSPGEQGENILEQFIHPGQKITLGLDENQYTGLNEDKYNSINAAVFAEGFKSVNRTLIEQGLAKEREGDLSAAASGALYSDFERLRGSIYETIAHMPIPFVHDKYMRIQSPLDAYKQEQVYGTSYSSWTNPIQSMLIPNFQRTISDGKGVMLGTAALALSEGLYRHSAPKTWQTAANIGLLLSSRTAFMGGIVGLTAKAQGGTWMRQGARIGAIASLLGYIYTRRDKPIEATLSFAIIGELVNQQLKLSSMTGKGAIVGGLIGLGISGMLSSALDKETSMIGPYIPERTKKRWEMQEYFDRINYLKYEGLYQKAARKAFIFERTNVHRLINLTKQREKEKDEALIELQDYKEKVEKNYPDGHPDKERLLAEIDEKIQMLSVDEEILLRGGKWTRSALIYKQAADSTIYGLKEDASWAQLLRATPTEQRDYILAFAKEKDPKKREEIRRHMSSYQQRILDIAWGEKLEEPESHAAFFTDHKLPNPMWSGWRPEVNLQDVEVKTINNEGMLLSDFGYYESQLRDMDVAKAPMLDFEAKTDPITLRKNLIGVLQGLGLIGVNVNIEHTTRPGIQVVADFFRIKKYETEQKIKEVFQREML